MNIKRYRTTGIVCTTQFCEAPSFLPAVIPSINICTCSGVGTGGIGTPVFKGGCSLQTPEGYNIMIIMPLSTKAVIQVHKDTLNEYCL